MQEQRRLARPVTDLKIRTSSISPELLHHFACTRLLMKFARGLHTCFYYVQVHISVNSTNLRFLLYIVTYLK